MKRGIVMALIWVAVLAAAGVVVMLLWNLLVPEIFGLAFINFWQATGMFILARILFGRMGFGHMMLNKRANHMRGRWMKMSPEERMEFINKRRRFGFGGPFGRDAFCHGMNEETKNER